MSNAGGKPKPTFFIAVLVVIAALVGFAVVRCSGKKKTDEKKPIDLAAIRDAGGGGGGTGAATGTVEDPNALDGVVTAKNYEYAPSEKLPPVPGTSDYKALGNPRVVKFAINVWAGWAPIIFANEGFKPKKDWKD